MAYTACDMSRTSERYVNYFSEEIFTTKSLAIETSVKAHTHTHNVRYSSITRLVT